MSLYSYIPVRKTEIAIGHPLPWSVFDAEHQLLLRAGFVIESPRQLELLAENGLFRHLESTASRPAPTWEPRAEPAPGIQLAFARTGIEVGTPVQLQNADNKGADKSYVRLVGYIENRTVLTTHPAVDGQLAFVKEGTCYACRAFHGKRALAFNANVIKAQLAPFPLLHLTYPEAVAATQVRGVHRVRADLVGAINVVGNTVRSRCIIRDLSSAGMQVHCAHSTPQVGQSVMVAFRINLDDDPVFFELTGMVRNCTTLPPDGDKVVTQVGIQLIEVPRETARLLEVYLYRQMLTEL